MSTKPLAAAWRTHIKPEQKLVLIWIADNDSGIDGDFTKVDLIKTAQFACIAVWQVWPIVEELIQRGYLTSNGALIPEVRVNG